MGEWVPFVVRPIGYGEFQRLRRIAQEVQPLRMRTMAEQHAHDYRIINAIHEALPHLAFLNDHPRFSVLGSTITALERERDLLVRRWD